MKLAFSILPSREEPYRGVMHNAPARNFVIHNCCTYDPPWPPAIPPLARGRCRGATEGVVLFEGRKKITDKNSSDLNADLI